MRTRTRAVPQPTRPSLGVYWRTLRQLLSYDPDQIQALYATPHSWTPFAVQEGAHRVVQTNLSRWDYKHQILESANVPNWRVLLWVKSIEAICQLRPRSLRRLFALKEYPSDVMALYAEGFSVAHFLVSASNRPETSTRPGSPIVASSSTRAEVS